MASSHPIPPFPADIDRDAFGYWLSGFADGEACFRLGMESRQRTKAGKLISFVGTIVELSIGIRADDFPALELIRSYLGAGFFQYNKANRRVSPNGNPFVLYKVRRIGDVVNCVIPAFDCYPLRAKKRRDYAIWRRGAILAYGVHLRERRTNGYHKGSLPKWTDTERGEFSTLISEMRAHREYEEPSGIHEAIAKTHRPKDNARMGRLFD